MTSTDSPNCAIHDLTFKTRILPLSVESDILTDIPVWDGVWEQATFRLSALRGRLLTAVAVSPLDVVVRTHFKDSSSSPLVTTDRCEK